MVWARNSFVYTQLRVIWLDRIPGDKDYERTPKVALPPQCQLDLGTTTLSL
jgi:hypothetical protein